MKKAFGSPKEAQASSKKKKLKDFAARKCSLVPKGTKSSDTPNSKYKDIQLFEINPV
jgi:hypothetical protein